MTAISYNKMFARLAALALLCVAVSVPAMAQAAFLTTSNLPFNAVKLVPNASASGSFVIENTTGSAQTVAVQVINTSGDFALFGDWMTFAVSGDTSGSWDLDDMTTQRSLTSVADGNTGSYTLTLTLKSNAPQLPLMGKSFGFDICIGFVGGEVECGTAFVPSGDSGTGGSGDNSQNSSRNRNGGIIVRPQISEGEVLGAQTCSEYLHSYIRPGGANDSAEVVKLQQFLRDLGGFPELPVTGSYDAQTTAAVRAFQQNYMGDVLSPWGLTQPTGYVYYTTRKTINEMYCQFTAQFPLTEQQLQEIARMRAAGSSFQPAAQSPQGEEVQSPVTEGITPEDLSASAAAAPLGWWSRFWSWLFGW